MRQLILLEKDEINRMKQGETVTLHTGNQVFRELIERRLCEDCFKRRARSIIRLIE